MRDRGAPRADIFGRPGTLSALAVASVLLLAAVADRVAAQEEDAGIQWLETTGRLSVYGELYDRSGIGGTLRPPRTGRINGQLTFSFADGALVVPLSMILATDQVAFRQNMNQIGLSPTWRWATAYIGHFSPEYSEYSLADATLLGGGAEVDAGSFRAGAVAGTARDAIAPRPGQIVVPEYRRTMQAARLGMGSTDGAHVDVFVLSSEDDPATIDSAQLSTPLAPEANIVTSVLGVLPLGGRVSVEGEVAFSEFEPDLRSDLDPVDGRAGRAALDLEHDDWSAGLELERVDGGFHNAGNTGLKNDRQDVRVRGQGRFWRGRVGLSGSVGLRQDNLSQAAEVTNERVIANLAGTVQPSPTFGLDFQIANDRQQADAVIRSRSRKTVTGNYSLTPRLIFRTGSAQHVLVGLAAHQRAVNTSPGVQTTVDTRSTTMLANWSVTFLSGLGLTLNTTRVETRFQQDSVAAATTITTLAPGVVYTAGQGRFRGSFQLQRTATGLESDFLTEPNTTSELFPVLELRFQLDPVQSVVLRSSYRRYDMTDGATLPGDPTTGGTFIERRISVGYTLTMR